MTTTATMPAGMQVKAFKATPTDASPDGTAQFILARLGDSPDLVDADGDLTMPGYFGRQTAAMVPAHDWAHVPIGKGTIFESGTLALCDARFNLDIPAAKAWFDALVFDLEHPPSVQEFSYGFTVKAGGSRTGMLGDRPVRYLQPLADGSPGVKVHEVSPVLVGAGVRTGLTRVGASAVPPKSDAHARMAAEFARYTRGQLDRSVTESLAAIRDRL